MYKINDTYVSTKDIMLIELETQTEYTIGDTFYYYFLIIRYFNGAYARIEVKSVDEYLENAEEICNIMRLREEKEKYENKGRY